MSKRFKMSIVAATIFLVVVVGLHLFGLPKEKAAATSNVKINEPK
jgi:preprotein translocase subunit SecG